MRCSSSSDPRGAKVNLIALADTAWMMATGDAADEDELMALLRWHVVLAITGYKRIAPWCWTQPQRTKYWYINAMGMCDEVGAVSVRIACGSTGCCCWRPCPTPSVIDTLACCVVCWSVSLNSFISSHHCAADWTAPVHSLRARRCIILYTTNWRTCRAHRTDAADSEWWWPCWMRSSCGCEWARPTYQWCMSRWCLRPMRTCTCYSSLAFRRRRS